MEIVSVSVLSTKLEIYRERQRQKKEKVGDRPAKLNVKKSDRELQQKIKKQQRLFGWKNNMKIL